MYVIHGNHTIKIHKHLIIFVALPIHHTVFSTRLRAPEGGVSILGLLFHHWLRANGTLQPPARLWCLGAGHGGVHECHWWTWGGTHESGRAGARSVCRITWSYWNPGCLAACVPDGWRTTRWSWADCLWEVCFYSFYSVPLIHFGVCGLIVFEDFGSAAYALRLGVAFSVHDFLPFKRQQWQTSNMLSINIQLRFWID